MNELVKVLNTGDTPLSLVDDDRRIVIPVKGERIVRFEQAAGWFGHPQARNTSRVRDRWDTFDRLRTFYGYYSGYDGPDEWEAKCPKFRVETLEGVYLPMVLDDPAGELSLPGELGGDLSASDSTDVVTLREQVDRQQAQIEKLLSMIAAREIATTPGIAPAEVVETDKLPTVADVAPTEDTPRATRLGRAKS